MSTVTIDLHHHEGLTTIGPIPLPEPEIDVDNESMSISYMSYTTYVESVAETWLNQNQGIMVSPGQLIVEQTTFSDSHLTFDVKLPPRTFLLRYPTHPVELEYAKIPSDSTVLRTIWINYYNNEYLPEWEENKTNPRLELLLMQIVDTIPEFRTVCVRLDDVENFFRTYAEPTFEVRQRLVFLKQVIQTNCVNLEHLLNLELI